MKTQTRDLRNAREKAADKKKSSSSSSKKKSSSSSSGVSYLKPETQVKVYGEVRTPEPSKTPGVKSSGGGGSSSSKRGFVNMVNDPYNTGVNVNKSKVPGKNIPYTIKNEPQVSYLKDKPTSSGGKSSDTKPKPQPETDYEVLPKIADRIKRRKPRNRVEYVEKIIKQSTPPYVVAPRPRILRPIGMRTPNPRMTMGFIRDPAVKLQRPVWGGRGPAPSFVPTTQNPQGPGRVLQESQDEWYYRIYGRRPKRIFGMHALKLKAGIKKSKI